MTTRERGLVIVLRIWGSISLLAIYAVVQPHAWMAATHAWLGLGEFPEQPIAAYLARSLSAFYAMVGGLVLVFSTDVRRYRAAIVYLAAAVTVLGVALFFVDQRAGLPPSWTWGEGPSVVAIGLLTGWLVGAVPKSE